MYCAKSETFPPPQTCNKPVYGCLMGVMCKQQNKQFTWYSSLLAFYISS